MKFFKQLYISNFFFYLLLGGIVLLCCSFIFPVLYTATLLVLFILAVFFLLDILILFSSKNGIVAKRTTPEKLSNGDDNPISISVRNYYTFAIQTKFIDEVPFQFQVRDFEITRKITKVKK